MKKPTNFEQEIEKILKSYYSSVKYDGCLTQKEALEQILNLCSSVCDDVIGEDEEVLGPTKVNASNIDKEIKSLTRNTLKEKQRQRKKRWFG